jgi:hydroxymethylglutaryl-CoA lyase
VLQLPGKILLAEVSPRDGLQSLPNWVDTDTKVRMIDRLSALGMPIIEVSSFTHPRVVPNLRDAEEVFARIKRRAGTVYRGLVPNARGAIRAVEANVGEMLGLITVSASYTRKNQNMSVDEAIEQNILAFRTAERHAIPFVMALGMAFWCSYEGLIPEESVIAMVDRFHNAGIRRFYLAGSLGMEDPAHVNHLFARLSERFADAAFGYHVHNLSGMATANVLAALDGGAQWLEGAMCGIGGGIAMPTTIGSVGNFAMEDLVTMLAEMGIDTGLDVGEVLAAGRDIAAMLDIVPQGHRTHGATRETIMQMAQSNPHFHP